MDRFATDAAAAAQQTTEPEVAHEMTMCQPVRYAMHSLCWHLLAGFSVSGLCCGVPAASYTDVQLPVPRPIWWRREARRGIKEIETFLS